MSQSKTADKVLFVALRLGFGIFLFLSQVVSQRSSFFTPSPVLLALGVIFVLAGVLLWIGASRQLRSAELAKEIANDGPFKYVRHPIYLSMYILCIGLGLMFFTWLWFVVLAVFFPLWYLECKKEEQEMIERYGDEYIDYRQETGMLLPKVI